MTIDEAVEVVLAVLPPHEAELVIEHNPHRSVYETVESYTADDEGWADHWVSDAERVRALETGELWVMQWYPHTPVGFCRIAASSLLALLENIGAERRAG